MDLTPASMRALGPTLIAATVLSAGFVLVAAIDGASLPWLCVTAGLSIATAALMVHLPRRVMLVVLAITWVLLPAVIGKYVGGHYALVWLMSSGVGIMAGQYPTYRRVLAQRAATKAEYGDRPQLLIDGTHTPGDLHTAHTAVQALDGHTQTIVSVLRGTARLDIGGNAATNQLLVYANATSNAATPPTSPPHSPPSTASGTTAPVTPASTGPTTQTPPTVDHPASKPPTNHPALRGI
jgi:hypothetical protein